jgi:hypothetical protein
MTTAQRPLNWQQRLQRLAPNGITRAFVSVDGAKALTQKSRTRRRARRGRNRSSPRHRRMS